jgi:quercetin dioxygenase-like cupin family protein
MTRELGAMALLLVSQATPPKDPVATDGDKYRVLLENEQVRVLSYTDRPGERTHQHQHPAFVLYALAPFKRKLVLPDGSERIREFKAGDVLYSAGEAHVGVNVGDTPTQVVIVELKEQGPRPAERRD